MPGSHHVREREERGRQRVVSIEGQDDERSVSLRDAHGLALSAVDVVEAVSADMEAFTLQALLAEHTGAIGPLERRNDEIAGLDGLYLPADGLDGSDEFVPHATAGLARLHRLVRPEIAAADPGVRDSNDGIAGLEQAGIGNVLDTDIPSAMHDSCAHRYWHRSATFGRRRNVLPSRDCKSRRVGLSGPVASLVVAVPRVTRQGTGRRVRALGMIRPRVCGGAGLAPAAGLIRSLSALVGVTHYSPAAAVSVHSDRRHWTLRAKPEDQRGCLQTRWITWSAWTRTGTGTYSRLSRCRSARLSRSARSRQTLGATRRRCASRTSTRRVRVSGRLRVPATTALASLAI